MTSSTTPGVLGRVGIEVELLAPPGASRRTLADELAGRAGGLWRPVWHADSEPSLVPGLGRFLHLTQGFEVQDGAGEPLCTLVDDVTLREDLDPRAPPRPGWHRLLTDDPRLLALLARHSDPGGRPDEALDPVGALWGSRAERHGDVYRLDDPSGATVALAAPVGGEQERPCEIVTPPLAEDQEPRLDGLLAAARDLGFTVPVEAAVHVHVDGAPFRNAAAVANVVRLFAHWRGPLHEVLATNQSCRRLGALPDALVLAADEGRGLQELREAARAGGLTKFLDVNLTQVLADRPRRDTLEVRILPGSIQTQEILSGARLVAGLLERCLDPRPVPTPPQDAAGARRDLLHLAVSALTGSG